MKERPGQISYTLYDNPLLRTKASVEDGRVRVKARGPLCMLPAVRDSLSLIDGQIPARAGDRLYLSTWLPPIPSRAFNRLAKSRVKVALGIRTPDQVTISITEECPNRCLHCALPDSGKGLRLEPEVVKGAIDQVLEMGATLINFDGGEPSTYEELPELVSAVDDRAISGLFTSGAGFTPSLARNLKEAGLHVVNISLDSPIQEEHDLMRGRSGVFSDAMAAARSALKAGLLVDIYVVIRHQNIHHRRAFHDLAREIGAQELTFFEVVPTGRWSGKRGVTLSGDDRTLLAQFVAEAKAPRIFSVPAALELFGCFAGRTWMHIAPSGDVYPCACLPQAVGNIFKEPIETIWRRMAGLPYQGSKNCPMRQG